MADVLSQKCLDTQVVRKEPEINMLFQIRGMGTMLSMGSHGSIFAYLRLKSTLVDEIKEKYKDDPNHSYRGCEGKGFQMDQFKEKEGVLYKEERVVVPCAKA